jgi:hypothetical protein
MVQPTTRAGQGNLTLYLMQGELQTDTFKDKRLWVTTEDGQRVYYTINYGRLGAGGDPATATDKSVKKKAVGWYDFVVPGDNPLVVIMRHSQRLYRDEHGKAFKDRGHSSVVGAGAPVYFAGELFFNPAGTLRAWTNKTGHYYVGAQFEFTSEQLRAHVERQTDLARDAAGARLLPMTAFGPWDGDL